MHVIAAQGSLKALQAVMLFVEQQSSVQLRHHMVRILLREITFLCQGPECVTGARLTHVAAGD